MLDCCEESVRDNPARRRRIARPRVRSQDYGGGAYAISSKLTVTGGSSIDSNTAYVSSPASEVADRLMLALSRGVPMLGHCERECSRRSTS